MFFIKKRLISGLLAGLMALGCAQNCIGFWDISNFGKTVDKKVLLNKGLSLGCNTVKFMNKHKVGILIACSVIALFCFGIRKFLGSGNGGNGNNQGADTELKDLSFFRLDNIGEIKLDEVKEKYATFSEEDKKSLVNRYKIKGILDPEKKVRLFDYICQKQEEKNKDNNEAVFKFFFQEWERFNVKENAGCGRHPIFEAAEHGRMDLVKWLVEEKKVSKNDCTYFLSLRQKDQDIVNRARQKGHEDVAKYLEEKFRV